jgi:phosphate transport system substrate-binding protein
MYPMFNLWIHNFTKLYSNVRINTQNTGSGQGQAYVEKGIVQIGGSAAFLTDAQQAANPNILNIPLAVTADIMDYNIIYPNTTNPSTLPQSTRWADLPVCKSNPAACRLNFTATLLTQIYNSTVNYWDDFRIKQINLGAAAFLPHEPIYATYRSDAAGDTLFFTQYLSSGDSWWAKDPQRTGLTVVWPSCVVNATVPACPQSALGNPGIVIATGHRAGSLSYVSVEALDQWVLCKTGSDLCSDYAPLDFGLLQNQAGKFVEATSINIQNALNATASQTPPDERFSLANAPGPSSYPIIGYGYALVNKQQITPEFAFVLRTFLKFCLLSNYGSSLSYLKVYHFVPLPSIVRQLSLNQVSIIVPN